MSALAIEAPVRFAPRKLIERPEAWSSLAPARSVL